MSLEVCSGIAIGLGSKHQIAWIRIESYLASLGPLTAQESQHSLAGLDRSVDAISKEPGTGEPTTDFAALYRDMSRNHSYEPAMPIADDPF